MTELFIITSARTLNPASLCWDAVAPKKKYVRRIFELRREKVTGERSKLHNEELQNTYYPCTIVD
jgi:hypothetical protein